MVTTPNESNRNGVADYVVPVCEDEATYVSATMRAIVTAPMSSHAHSTMRILRNGAVDLEKLFREVCGEQLIGPDVGGQLIGDGAVGDTCIRTYDCA